MREERETEREREREKEKIEEVEGGRGGGGGNCEIKEGKVTDCDRLIYIAVISVVIKIGVWHEQRK